ncbi:MAG TPA: Flp family type IVb pilin [Nocardioides sp.]|nr:Flp family type IVb pilin [Nocardioides sp.]
MPAGTIDSRPLTERGASSVEYALLVALIAGVIISAVLVLSPQVLDLFDSAVSAPW